MNLIHDFQRYKINTITISYTLIASFSQGIWLWIDNVCRNNFKVPIEIMVGFDLSLTIFHSMLMKIIKFAILFQALEHGDFEILTKFVSY